MFSKCVRWVLLALALSACTAVFPVPSATPQPVTANASLAATPSPAAPPSRPVSPDAPQRIDLADDLYLRQIGDGAFVVTHTFPWGSNAVLVEMADRSWVLAGSTNTPEAMRVLLDWLESQFGDVKITAINTGYHVDNLGGNQALLAASIPVYGSDLTAELIVERSEDVRRSMLDAIGDKQSAAYQAQLETAYLPPDHVFKAADGLTLAFGGEEVQVIYPGPSQAPDKLAVYFPVRKLLFGSCTIIGMEKLGNTADADLQHWPEALRQLEMLAVDVVVPGHGARLDPGLIRHTLDLLSALPY
ncbi:MAG: MBL fold metallo-hydrolase [Chloroflexota bacterium]